MLVLYISLNPALTRWAKVRRASGAIGGVRNGDVKSPLHRREHGAELAGGEALEGVEALGKFWGAEAVLAVEPAKEVRGRTLARAGVAWLTEACNPRLSQCCHTQQKGREK